MVDGLGYLALLFAVGCMLLSAYVVMLFVDESGHEPMYLKWPWEE
jgi:hypothetical protein